MVTRRQDDPDRCGGHGFELVPIDGSRPSSILINGLATSRGTWSPDGQWIVFSGIASSSTGADIYIVRADGTDLHQVTNTPGLDEEFGDQGGRSPVGRLSTAE